MSSTNHANNNSSNKRNTHKKPNSNSNRSNPDIQAKSTSTRQPNIPNNKLPPGSAAALRTNPLGVSPSTRENVPLNSSSSSAALPEVYRDSVLSLRDDPFFRNYTTPHTEGLARELHSVSAGNFNMATADQPPASILSSDINIAIIGAEGAGKTTLIQRALGLRKPPATVASSLRMNIDNATYTISLIELDLEAFDITNDRRIRWPKQINGVIMPYFDGALILYDVMNSLSIADLPQTLNALTKSSIPSIIVATKCENPPNTRQIDTEKMEAACPGCVESRQTSANKPESARNALSAMLRAILSHRSNGEIYGPRRRAASSANLNTLARDVARPIHAQQNKHNRASSDLSLLKGFPNPSLSSPSRSQPLGRSALSEHAPVLEAPPLSDHPAFRKEILAEMFSAGDRPKDSFDSDADYKDQDDVPILQRYEVPFIKNEKSEKFVGLTLDDLVDRLLSQNMSRHDTNFQEIFLCLYRKFASPGELFSAILQRLEQTAEDESIHHLIRVTTQLRILNVIIKWIDSYPGDFASSQTSYRLDAFIKSLSHEPAFGAAAKELRFQLDNRVMVDDDTGWAQCDPDAEGISESQVRHPDDLSRMDSMTIASDEDADSYSRRPSAVPSTSSTNATSHEELPAPVTYHTVEDYEREARTLVPRSTLPLTKIRYHIFMDTPDDDFAEEMTRIDWIMFSSIRIRDLVRHVSLSLDEKEKCRSLANVNRMTNHFNHIAKWVSNMVLMRDKAKHRALMLEKFMRIALKLRILNNYNGLGAVIAGINGTAVHRLTQTRALIHPDTAKRFMRLELLMGNQKSHFAYRLAWENSPMPRIPFIPLHRRDLVSAEEGSRTWVGGQDEKGRQRINWRKFEVLGEVILPVLRSQVQGYGELKRREVARELVLDCRMPTDEEDIYQRSVAVESSSNSSTMGDFGKKKFPWFQK